jgi:hypothetical protein
VGHTPDKWPENRTRAACHSICRYVIGFIHNRKAYFTLQRKKPVKPFSVSKEAVPSVQYRKSRNEKEFKQPEIKGNLNESKLLKKVNTCQLIVNLFLKDS